VSKNIIELNGKQYDAITGALLGDTQSNAGEVAAERAKAVRHGGRAIDGIVRPTHAGLGSDIIAPHTPKPAHHHAAKPAHHNNHAAHTKKPAAHRQAHQLSPHQPERPKTLMRTAVHKPSIVRKPALKPQAPAELAAAPIATLAPKLSASQVSPQRLSRAQRTPQSQYIKRFDIAPARRTMPAAVAAPAHASISAATAMPVADALAMPAAAPTPATPPASQDIFEAAIAHATSHEQTAPKRAHRRHHRLANIGAGAAAVLLIAGFVTYLNMANIEVRVASIRAGFSAQLPGYAPTGYALSGPIKSKGGHVQFSFRSGASSYTISQQASDWDSQTLLDNTVALAGSHQTVQSRGRTIYIYDNNRASWVNGGVRYDITGNATLNPDDIASIASSM